MKDKAEQYVNKLWGNNHFVNIEEMAEIFADFATLQVNEFKAEIVGMVDEKVDKLILKMIGIGHHYDDPETEILRTDLKDFLTQLKKRLNEKGRQTEDI